MDRKSTQKLIIRGDHKLSALTHADQKNRSHSNFALKLAGAPDIEEGKNMKKKLNLYKSLELSIENILQNMSSHDLEPPEQKCPFCGSSDRSPEYILLESPQVLLLKCNNCKASSASRIPKTGFLAKYYKTDFYESILSHPDEQEQVTFDNVSRFGKHLTKKFLQYCQHDTHITVLDFGGGDGSISYSMAIQLIQKGIDKIDITIVDYSKGRTILSNDSRISIEKRDTIEDVHIWNYDVVIASAVIEHIPKPGDILDSLLSHLRKGGIFYARTPYVAPLMKVFNLVGIKLGFLFPYPVHLHDLGENFWKSYFGDDNTHYEFKLLESKPSIVETTFRNYFMRTVVVYFLKAPWYIFGSYWKLVGGWEVFAQRNLDKNE